MTFTERCRGMLSKQPYQPDFTLSRGGLETLVRDSEHHAQANKVGNALLLTARDIACDTTMRADEAQAWISGHWDDSLPRVLRAIARGHLKTIGVENQERGISPGLPRDGLMWRLAHAVWMVGNMDTDEDKAQWWKDFDGLWNEAAAIIDANPPVSS